jgi:hypothetical protein
MRTRLRRICHTVTSASVTHGLPSALISLDFADKWLQLPYSFFTHTRTAIAFLLTIGSLVFKVVAPPLYRHSRRCILKKQFPEGLLNTSAWICFRILNHTKDGLYERHPFFFKLLSLTVKIGGIEIYRQFWNIWEFDFPLCWLYVAMLGSFLIFYSRKCINHLWTLGRCGD